MSAMYQGEVIELTSSDLQVLEQELNQSDDYQALTVLNEESWLDELEARWDSDYEPCPLTEDEEREWLQYEQERLESAILETEENYL